MENDEHKSTSQTYVGDGKKIDIRTNSGVLRVVGNNCCVTVSKNEGQITIAGNKGRLQVIENTGYIGYVGNNGLVEVGTTFKGVGQVVYTGNGGTVRRMKTKGVSGKCSATRKNCKSPVHHESKQEDANQIKKSDVKSELRINGVEVSVNPKSKKVFRHAVTKENVNPEKLKRISSQLSSCCCKTRKVWGQPDVQIGEQKTVTIQTSHQRSIEVVNVSHFELEKWCLNLASELVVL